MCCVFVCACLSVSEPPVRLWPAGCWEHGEGGWALETSPSTAWVCGGGGHPAEQVTHQQLCESPLFWVRVSPDFFSSITLHLFLSQFTCWFSHSLISFIFSCAVLFQLASCFPPPLSSLVLTVLLLVFFFFPSCLSLTELFILAQCWRLRMRPPAAPARHHGTLFM